MAFDHETSEAELLARSLKQDPEALGVLVERYAEPILNLAFRMTGNKPAAHAIARETFVSAFHALTTVSPESRFSIKLFRVAVCHCHAWLHARQSEQPRDGDLTGGEPPEACASQAFPESSLDRLDQALYQLPPLYREAFVLRHVEGLTYGEIGTILDVNQETLKSRVYEARTRLCEYLAEFRQTDHHG
jgi:RNA polymerase sigma-70 factor (ECF subfamily)